MPILLLQKIGETWITNLETELIKLEKFADDKGFQNAWHQIKHQNKIELAHLIKEQTGIEVDPDSLFDIQVKRFHEYKRQHLNVLYIISLYNRIKKNPAMRLLQELSSLEERQRPVILWQSLLLNLSIQLLKL